MSSKSVNVATSPDNPDQEKAQPPNTPPQDVSSFGGRPACFKNTLHECLFVLTATLASAQTSMYQGATVTITASIGADLNMTSAEIAWISAGSALSGGAFLLSFGKLADMFGRRNLFIFAMAGYSAAMLVAGFASNAIYMDVFSGVIGLFSAAAVPPAVGALGAAYERPSRRKNIAFSCFSAGGPLGFIVGMVISGIAAHVSSWRASFWTLAVLFFIFTILTIWVVPTDTAQPVTLARIKQYDILGTFLVIAGFGAFSSALTLAGEAINGWKTNYVIALLVIGVVLLALFLYWQSIATYPLMPLYVWKDRNFSLVILTFCLCYMGFASVTFYLPLYMQQVKHYSALEITSQLLPMIFGGILTNVCCAFIMHRVDNRILLGVGVSAYIGSFLILSFMNAEAIYWEFVFPALVLMVLGVDMQFNIVNVFVMSSLPAKDQSIAGGILHTANELCANIGLGISTSVYASVRNRLPEGSSSIRPYLSAYWFSAAAAGVSLFLVPFMTFKTQGGKGVDEQEEGREGNIEGKRGAKREDVVQVNVEKREEGVEAEKEEKGMEEMEEMKDVKEVKDVKDDTKV